MAVDKINGFKAPYTSATFRKIADTQEGRNGLLKMVGEVVNTGMNVSIPVFTVIQQGLIYDKNVPTLVSSPTMEAPYYVVVTAPTPGRTDNLIFTFAKGPSDITNTQVLLARYDGIEWRKMPIISVDGVYEEKYLENIVTGRVGPYYGLRTSVGYTEYENTSGTLIDKRGQVQIFNETASFPIIEEDPDWPRVDRILYRRPSDSEKRIGYRKFLLGGTFASPPAANYITTLFNSSNPRLVIKTLIASDNTAHILCSSGSGGTYSITYSKVSSDRKSVLISEFDTIGGLSDPGFDAIIDPFDNIHIVYVSSSNIVYQMLDTTGTPVGASDILDTQTGACLNPRCSLDAGGLKLYTVYQSLVGVLNQIFFTVRDIPSSSTAVPPKQITETSTPVNNLISPDIYVDMDYVAHIVWENLSATSIQYQEFDDIGVALGGVQTISGSTTYGTGILAHAAKAPRVTVSDNFNLSVFFRQSKGASDYGIAIWNGTSATMQDIISSSEDFDTYDMFVEPVFNGLTLVLSQSLTTDLVTLQDGVVSFTITLMPNGSNSVAIARDKLGSFYTAWSYTTGADAAKTPSQIASLAYSYRELDGDILLTRILQPGPVILNWARGGRPGSFFDFLAAYGESVTMSWEETLPNVFKLGMGVGSTDLKILDLFTNTSWTIEPGSYTILDGEALFARLDISTLTVTPEVLPVALLPWDEDIGVIGMNMDGEFHPILLGMAGMAQLDSGESVIFGEDLDASVRARLGILSETTYQAYTSTIGQNYADTYPQALSNIDIMAGQNRHVRLIGYEGDWNVIAADTLRILSTCYVQIPGLPHDRNTVAPQSIVLDTDGQIAYVSLNRTPGAAAFLTVSVALASSVTLTRNTFVLARRVGTDIEVDSQGVTYTDRLSVGQINNVVQDGENLERAIKRLDVREDVVKRVTVITRTHSTLPLGSTCTIDEQTLVDGDKVLFAHSLLNGIYQISGVGVSISWTKLYEFAGSQSPTVKSCVLVTSGGDINRTLWSYDSLKGWYRLSTLEDFVEVRVADFTTTTLPSGAGPLVVDGETINEGELVLYGNAALNRVYRVTGIGTAIAFETMNIFSGLETPLDGSLVLAQDGTVSDMLWEYNEELPGWVYLTPTTQNKIYLGLNSPSKSGGEYEDQIIAGQLNNLVQEGDPLEKAIKRLDIRGDVLKRARVVSTLATSLPTVAPLVIDGTTIADGNVVLFGSTVLDGLYQAAISGVTITWTKLYAFSGATTGSRESLVYVNEGTFGNIALWARDSSRNPPWYKLVDPALIQELFDIVALHTDEINDLQNAIAAILANRPDFEIFTATAGGQSVFNLTRFTVSPDNTLLDVYVMWNGRWQTMSRLGDFSDGQFRKNSATQIEMSEVIPEGQEIEVFIWDPAALLVRTAKEQKFVAGLGGQSIFTLDPLKFTLEPDNAVIDAEYFYQGRWQHQSLAGDFSDGALRKNSITEIETAVPLPEGTEFIIIRRVPVGGSSGGGGGTDLTNITTSLGFAIPGLSVGTLAKPAGSLILKDTVTTDIWEVKVESGTLKVVKIN